MQLMTDKQKAQTIFRSELTIIVCWLAAGIGIGFLFDQLYSGLVVSMLLLLARYIFITIGIVAWLFLGYEIGTHSIHTMQTIIERIKATITQQQMRKKQTTNLARGFRDLLRALPDALVLIDREKKIEWFNDRASQFLPLQKGDAGNLITALVRNPDFVYFVQQADYTTTPIIRMQTNENRYLRIHKIVYSDSSDLLVFRNITRIYQMQQQQISFIAHASHELNTPLTGIKGYTELAQSQLPHQAPEYELLQKAIDQTDRLADLTKDLLTLAALDQKQKSSYTPKSSCMPSEIITKVLEQLRLVAEYTDRKVVVDATESALLFVQESAVITVCTNLIENALKYSAVGTEVQVFWSTTVDGRGKLSIIDQGEGIPAAHISRITERFYRAPRPEGTSDPGGTGLGMSIVQSIIDLYKGELQVHSRAGKGSTVTCFFPVELVTSVT